MTVDDLHLIIGKQQVKIEKLESDRRTLIESYNKLAAELSELKKPKLSRKRRAKGKGAQDVRK